MKILFVDQFSQMGGAQRCFADLLPALEERGWQVQAALPGDGPFTRLLPTTPIPCGPYRSGAKARADFARFGYDVFRQTQILAPLMRSADLVYVNGPRVLTACALAHHGVPILFHAHNFLDRSYAAALARWSVKRAQAQVVACSEFVADTLRSVQLKIIPNGVPDMGFRHRTFEKPWRIGMIGRLEDQKNQVDFLKAAPAIPDAHFILCGEAVEPDGPYLRQVRELARGLDVEFAGTSDDMPVVYQKLDLLVVASKQEGLCRVMLEAFSAGVPVVGYAAGSIVEVIEHGRSGFLIPERSPQALAAQIKELLKAEPTLLQQVASNARQAFEQSFTLAEYRRSMIAAISETARRT